MSALEDLLLAHRPYGLDCKCGEPINSDAYWVHHLMTVVAIRDEPPADDTAGESH